eukprot:scaffold1298_cov382-Prasinococcus_capsulatus_cf.AAC.9
MTRSWLQSRQPVQLSAVRACTTALFRLVLVLHHLPQQPFDQSLGPEVAPLSTQQQGSNNPSTTIDKDVQGSTHEVTYDQASVGKRNPE